MNVRRALISAAVAGVLGCACTGYALAAVKAAAKPRPPVPRPSGTLTIVAGAQSEIALTAVIKKFELAYPRVNVQPQYVDGSNLSAVLSVQIQAGNVPDIAFAGAGRSAPYYIWSLSPRGPNSPTGANKLLAIAGPWTKSLPPSVAAYMQVNHKYYGAPVGVTPEVVMYNTAIFNSLGLKPPRTFSQLLSVCQKITAAGKTPFAYAGPLTTPYAFLDGALSRFVYASDPTWNAQRLAHKVSVTTSPGWKRTLAAWLQMKAGNCFAPGAVATTQPQALADFAQGSAAMFMGFSAFYGAIAAISPNINVNSFDFPGDTAKQRGVAVGLQQNLEVFKGGHNRTAARAFINFIMLPKEAALYDNLTGGISLHDYTKGTLPPFLSGIEADAKYRTVVAPSTAIPFSTWLTSGVPLMVSLYTGQLSPAQTLQQLDQLW